MEFAAPLARVLLYGGALLSIGRGTLTVFDPDDRGGADVLAGAIPVPRAVRVSLWLGVIALVLAPMALLLVQQRALELTPADLPGLLRETVWGRGWVQLAIPCLLSAVFLPLRSTRTMSVLLLVAALGVAAAMGGLGHAAADEQWPLASRVFDAVHVVSAGAWIGGLLLMVLTTAGGAVPSAGAWRAFSRTATVTAPLVMLSGVGSSWRRIGASGPMAILASDYGRLLLLKLVLALVVLALGATQRRRIGDGSAPAQRMVLREVLIAAVVLGATAWMTGMEPPGA